MNCLVTGASRGIGWAVAQRLAREGRSVTLCARDRDQLEERRGQLAVVNEQQTHRVWAVDFGEAAVPVPDVEVDVLVNSAGVAATALLAVQTPQSIEQALRVNLVTPILLSKAVVRSMLRRRRGGHLIYISSLLAQRGCAGSSVYSASKAGLEGFTRSLAREVGAKGIRVNCIAPGVVDTDMGRKADPALLKSNIIDGLIPSESIADTVMFLLANQHVTGQTIAVDNGSSA